MARRFNAVLLQDSLPTRPLTERTYLTKVERQAAHEL